MKILAIKQLVNIIKPDIEGFISTISIGKNNNISYEITYWKDTERKTVWVEEWELKAEGPEHINLGFKG